MLDRVAGRLERCNDTFIVVDDQTDRIRAAERSEYLCLELRCRTVVTIWLVAMLRGGIAERGGVRVGHRIIEINNQSVVATSHEKIVNILANSVGEVSLSLLTYFLRFFIGN